MQLIESFLSKLQLRKNPKTKPKITPSEEEILRINMQVHGLLRSLFPNLTFPNVPNLPYPTKVQLHTKLMALRILSHRIKQTGIKNELLLKYQNKI